MNPLPVAPPALAEACDIPSALSSLTSLLSLSWTTLHYSSLSSLTCPNIIPCPFNPNHRLPPCSLFSHSVAHHIQNPHTLHSDSHFYSDCPAVVSFPTRPEIPPMLALPPVLSSVCAKPFTGFPMRILPSDVCSIREETESWNDYPFMYSYSVLRGILTTSFDCLSTFLIANSARYYRIVLDLPMMDHMLLLFKLCLKAILREAIDLFVAEESVSSNRWFKCPILVQALTWLATQLSILYGKINGKLFAINMLKQCICDSAFTSIFNESEPQEGGETLMSRIESDETLCKSPICVSQVAAAVAALHERSMLEEKIKALRNLPSLPAYQRSMEHAYISNKAEEERKKRPNYRALLEHDGLLWRHSQNNQDSNRTKTKEELLAEERDYKRRRMSYRGKKLKRSTTQVMRDIIEEYMEEIKQAGAINCPTKGGEEAECPLSTTYRTDNYYMNKGESGKRQLNSSASSEGSEDDYLKEFHTDGNVHPADSKDDFSENMEKKASHWHHLQLAAEKSNGRSRQSRKDYCSSPSQRGTRAYSRETTISQEKRDYSKDSRDDLSRSSSRRR